MTTADVLNRAADLVAKGWVQGSRAVTVTGIPVPPWVAGAVRWCADGAIEAVCHTTMELEFRARTEVTRLLPHQLTISAWNDTEGRTQLAVVRKLRAAAKRAT